MIKFTMKATLTAALWRVQEFLWHVLTWTLGTIRSMLCLLFGIETPQVTLSRFKRIANRINAMEDEVSKLSQEEMRAETESLRARLKNKHTTLDAILPRAFALVREASKRTLGLRHHNVQLIGGMAMHRGMIAEMCTGEGKTLVATLPAYLNALTGDGVQIVTVNDYLAQRDSDWMGQVHEYLGLSVACITHNTPHHAKQLAYAADIVYVTNSELVFDYLRDNMCTDASQMAQRPLRHFNYAIVDETDSILIDEARTPLIISGPSDSSIEMYAWVDVIIKELKPEDYTTEEKRKIATFTKQGIHKVEEYLRKQMILEPGKTLYDPNYIEIVHALQQSLKAHALYKKDDHYILKDGEVLLIDEFTGRVLDGRRYSDGLHQAIEAKERVDIKEENVTIASITYQNYFRMYTKLAGMTGTASTEAPELKQIYNLDVLTIPTHRPILRKDRDDQLYFTNEDKLQAVVKLVKELHARGQPVLVGTASVEKSEEFSAEFTKQGIPHNMLNARNHHSEAEIIADAGMIGAVTIATNMAGRGTDIKLGGSCEETKAKVLELGGLFVIGTERHESRRIDNQLRGRSGRQGDPGASQFFVCLEDRLMRMMQGIESAVGSMKPGESMSGYMINYSITTIQRKVEEYHYDIRKHILKYDEVMNEQRKVVYKLRRDVVLHNPPEASLVIFDTMAEVVNNILSLERIQDVQNISQQLFDLDVTEHGNDRHKIGVALISACLLDAPNEQVLEKVFDALHDEHNLHSEIDGKPAYTYIKAYRTLDVVRGLFLQIIDRRWTHHLRDLDYTKQQCQLQGYAQRDPVNAYKNAALATFESLLSGFKEELCSVVTRIPEYKDSADVIPDYDMHIVKQGSPSPDEYTTPNCTKTHWD
jgi:preprotein translocase subunit SecA